MLWAVTGGKIEWVGPRSQLPASGMGPETEVHDAGGAWLTPRAHRPSRPITSSTRPRMASGRWPERRPWPCCFPGRSTI